MQFKTWHGDLVNVSFSFFLQPLYDHPFVEVAKLQKDGSFTTVQRTKPDIIDETELKFVSKIVW